MTNSIVDILSKKVSFTVSDLVKSLKLVGITNSPFVSIRDNDGHLAWRTGLSWQAAKKQADQKWTVGDVNHITIQLGSEFSHVSIEMYHENEYEPFTFSWSFEIREEANMLVSLCMTHMRE